MIAEGTVAYLITLDSGFRIMYRDSGGRVTDQEKAVMARVGSVDHALVAVAAEYLMPLTARQGLEHMRLYKPAVYMPAHHDAPISGRRSLWRATEPLFYFEFQAPNRFKTTILEGTDDDLRWERKDGRVWVQT